MKRAVIIFLVLVVAVISAGCGYATRSLAYSEKTRIFVRPFENKIDLNINAEYSDQNPYRIYRPGMETKVTDAVINKFLADGYLKVVSKEEQADIILSGALTNYEKQPLKYDQRSENVEEYRANIVVNISLEDITNAKTSWSETGFVGFSEFALTGPKAKSEDAAVNEAVEDLATRIVERTLEDW